MQSLSLNWIRQPPFPCKARVERPSIHPLPDGGSGLAPRSPRTLQHPGSPSHAQNNLRQLHDQRASRQPSAPGSPRLSPRQGARAAPPVDAPVVGAAYAAPGLLDRPDLLAAVCAGWATGAGATSGTGLANAFTDNAGGDALPATLFAGGLFNLLCSLVDTGLTLHAWREAHQQYQAFEALLGAQHLLLHQLNDQLRHGPEPRLRAARDLAQFNVDALTGLLKGFEKAYLLGPERERAIERRQLHLDHLVSADEALRLRQQALAYPDERRQGLADHAERQRDALQARIDAFDAASRVPLFERMREGLSHPLDLLAGLSDEQIAFLRDGALQGAKIPFQLFSALATLLPHLLTSGAALDTVGQAVPPVAVLLALAHLLTANWDRVGGQKRMGKARAARLAKLQAFERVVWGLSPDSVTPGADPEQVKQALQVRRNLARQLAKAIQRTNQAKRVAWARKFRGKFNLVNFLLSLLGLAAMAAGTGSYGAIPAAVVGSALGLFLLTHLAKYQAYLAADKQRMRRRDREARALRDADGFKASELYAGRLGVDAPLNEAQRQALRHNTYLSLDWLQGQLYEVGLQASQAPGGAPPPCDAERALLDAGVAPDTLRALRQAAWVRTRAQHGQLVRAVATGTIGLRLFPSDPSAPLDGHHAPVPVLRTQAAQAPTPFAHLADLDEAVKHAGKAQLRRDHNRVGRLARGFGRKSLATPGQALKALERHERRGDTEALAQLRRDLLQPLLSGLPLRPDGLGIAWPERYQGGGEDDPDTADCLIRCLRELQDTCRLGQLALADEQEKGRWSDRWMRRRLRDCAELAERLIQAVQQERAQPEPWWDALVDGPPVFRPADDEAEPIDLWSSGREGDEALSVVSGPPAAFEASFHGDAPEQAANRLPAYAVKV